MKNLVTLFDLSADEVQQVLARAAAIKSQWQQDVREPLLQGKVLALLFEKPSLRTRLSFEAGMAQLGGTSLFLGKDVGWGDRESIEDFARVLGQYVDAVACRANSHQTVQDLARLCGRPVINALTDYSHPCQALADLMTLRERRAGASALKLAYVGDGNNVARSLAICCGRLGVSFAIASPAGYALEPELIERIRRESPGADLLVTEDPAEAVREADGVYTDVWASMGQESEQEQRAQDFAAYQVNAALMRQAPADACFLHCLPARRGEEVTDEVIDGPQSAVLQQAANRMHAQKGLLAWLLAGHGG